MVWNDKEYCCIRSVTSPRHPGGYASALHFVGIHGHYRPEQGFVLFCQRIQHNDLAKSRAQTSRPARKLWHTASSTSAIIWLFLLFFLFLIFFREAVVLDHSRTPCKNPNDFIPLTKNKIYVFYIRMDSINDFTTWSNVANCLKIWDLDPRGFHKRLWRLWLKDNHVLIVGCPVSPYCNYKPSRLQPIHIPKKKKSWK